MKTRNLLLSGLLAFTLCQQSIAQSTLPTAVSTIDFEGVTSAADLDAEQVGEGAFLKSSDLNFGTYYQNKPTVKTWGRHANYLIVPTDGFQKAQSKGTGKFSLAFWVNGYVANANMQNVNHYYSSLISAYGANSYKTWSWPVFNVRTRGNLQINCDGWSDYTNEENVNGVVKEDNSWILTTGTDFDANWHYIAIVFSGINAKYYIDGTLWNEWNATNNNYDFPNHMNPLTALYLGDGTCWDWSDPDGAYAFDDISFYATALTVEQIELLMNEKRNRHEQQERLAYAKAQLQATLDEATEYQAMLQEEGFLKMAKEFDTYLKKIDVDSYDNVETINAKNAEILTKTERYNTVVSAAQDAKSLIDYYAEYCTKTAYNGASDFQNAISTAKTSVSDPTSTTVISSAMKLLEEEKNKYVFTQSGNVIDVSKVIKAPWFVDERYEPTIAPDGTITYPAGAADHLTRNSWIATRSDNLYGYVDLNVYFTNGRTTANLFHKSTVIGGVLNLYQTITNLPVGYYSVSADMSSSVDPTDNHIYAISGGTTVKSSTPSNFGKWVAGEDTSGEWTTLNTGIIFVGTDGKLTIGATSTTDGTLYKGWFCATNFRLNYYGTNVQLGDIDNDGETTLNDITELINIYLSTDKDKYVSTCDMDNDTKVAVSDIAALIDKYLAVGQAYYISSEYLGEWEEGFVTSDNYYLLTRKAEDGNGYIGYLNDGNDNRSLGQAIYFDNDFNVTEIATSDEYIVFDWTESEDSVHIYVLNSSGEIIFNKSIATDKDAKSYRRLQRRAVSLGGLVQGCIQGLSTAATVVGVATSIGDFVSGDWDAGIQGLLTEASTTLVGGFIGGVPGALVGLGAGLCFNYLDDRQRQNEEERVKKCLGSATIEITDIKRTSIHSYAVTINVTGINTVPINKILNKRTTTVKAGLYIREKFSTVNYKYKTSESEEFYEVNADGSMVCHVKSLESGVTYYVVPVLIPYFYDDFYSNGIRYGETQRLKGQLTKVEDARKEKCIYYSDSKKWAVEASIDASIVSLEEVASWGVQIYSLKTDFVEEKILTAPSSATSYTFKYQDFLTNEYGDQSSRGFKLKAVPFAIGKGDTEKLYDEGKSFVIEIDLCPDSNHPHVIDLGLPSGTKWACCNIGASSPEEYGGYYAWGETEEKSVYTPETYKYAYEIWEYGPDDARVVSKWWDADWHWRYFEYTNIGLDISGTSYDVAHVKWGGNWCMPTEEQQKEIIHCSSEWTSENGVYGIRFTGPNGASVFLPAAGYRWDGDNWMPGRDGLYYSGDYGYYLSSSYNSYYDNVHGLFFSASNGWRDSSHYSCPRDFGHSVRAVCP